MNAEVAMARMAGNRQGGFSRHVGNRSIARRAPMGGVGHVSQRYRQQQNENDKLSHACRLADCDPRPQVWSAHEGLG